MVEIFELLNNAILVVQTQYSYKMDEMFLYNNTYYLKACFIDKYASLKQMLDDGIASSVTIGLYNTTKIYNTYDITKDEFIPIYKSVCQKNLDIQKKVQELKATLDNLRTETDTTKIISTLNTIISTDNCATIKGR